MRSALGVEALSGVLEFAGFFERPPNMGAELAGWNDRVDVGVSSAGGIASAEPGFIGEPGQFEPLPERLESGSHFGF